jgi:hypothetical protein
LSEEEIVIGRKRLSAASIKLTSGIDVFGLMPG